MTGTREQIRAVFLAAIMVISVFGMSAAFAGSAVAEATDLDIEEEYAQPDETITAEVTVEDGSATFVIEDTEETVSESVTVQDGGDGDDSEEEGVIATELDLSSVFDETPTDGEATVYVAEDAEVSSEEFDDSATVEIDSEAPELSDAQLTAGDETEIVAEGDEVTVSVNVTVANNIETLTADISAFVDAETETLDLPAESGVQSETFTVEANAINGDQAVTITATDEAGNTADVTTPALIVDTTEPQDIEFEVGEDDEVVLSSTDNLDVIYEYVEENTAEATITLEGETYDAEGSTYTYDIDDDAYIDEASKAITLDLNEQANELDGDALADGAYALTIEVTDEAGNTNATTTDEPAIVVDDESPNLDVTDVSETENIAPDETIEVTYEYEDATDASELRLFLFDTEGEEDPVRITAEVDHESGEVFTYEFDLSDADSQYPGTVQDNTVYHAVLEVEDSVSWTPSSEYTYVDEVVVNAEEPSIEHVEANAGEDTVTVQFSEPIGDSLDRTAFAYQDVSDEGASQIEAVSHYEGSATATLHLDADVAPADLGQDRVSARSGEIPDTAPDGYEKYVDSGVAVTLEDTTDPSVTPTDVTAPTINQLNEESYDVDVNLDREIVDVTVTVTDNGDEVADTVTEQRWSTTVADLNVSELDDGDVNVMVEVEDAGGNSDSTVVTVEKDTVSPEIEDVQADAGTDTIYVEFDQEMDNVDADAFELDGVDADIWYVYQLDATSFEIHLSEEVPFDAIDDVDEANITATDSVTDQAGNPAVSDAVALDDTVAPSLDGVSAEVNSDTVEVQFSEGVVNASGEDLGVEDFVYHDESEDGASEIVDVEHTAEDRAAIVTLDEDVTEIDHGTDEIGIVDDAVYDANDNVAAAQTLTVADSIPPHIEAFDTDVEDDTITYTIESDQELGEIEVDIWTEYVIELDHFPENEVVDETITEDDFELVDDDDMYVYEFEYDAPRDGEYNAHLEAKDLASNTAFEFSEAVVHTDNASIVGATIPYGGSGPWADADEQILVTLDEPVDAEEIQTTDVYVEGADVVNVHAHDPSDPQYNEFGQIGFIVVDLAEPLQTGDEPTVSVDGNSFAQLAGDEYDGQDSAATVNTQWNFLEEGTNFVSVPAVSGSQDLDDIDTSNVDVIWTYDEGEWQSYDPDANENDFDALEGGQGYIVEMEDDDVFEINVFNQEAGSTDDVDGALLNQQQLEEGWNLVGHYQTYHQSTGHALASIDDDVHLVYGQDDGFDYEQAGDFEPGEAYWVFVTDDTVYTFTP